MRIAHEAPLSIFDQVENETDYSYFLVHLFEENEEYLEKAIEASKNGRHVILDNSVFELGEAFDSERFLYWINKTNPTEYIIPDVLEDSKGTILNIGEWLATYQHRITTDSKSIGVVQGNSIEEIKWCYSVMRNSVDKIAFSFDYSFMCDENIQSPEARAAAFVRGRQELLKELLEDGIIDIEKPHHLLGCYSAREFSQYKDYAWVDTLDTSNPVIAGYFGYTYEEVDGAWGLSHKPMQKLHTIMNEQITDDQLKLIMSNIELFRKNIEN